MYKFSIALDDNNSETYGITNWELKDGYFGAPLAAMTPDQIEDTRNLLLRKMVRIVLYSVQMPVSDYAAYVQFFRNAHLLRVENVQLCFDAIKDATDGEIRKVIAIGEAFSIKILFGLEAAAMEKFDLARYSALRSPNTGLIFDPNEYVKQHINPYLGMLYKMKLKGDIVFLRVCDMVYDSLTPVLPEQGNAEVKECVSNLLSRSFGGYFAFRSYGKEVPLPAVIDAFTNALCAM